MSATDPARAESLELLNRIAEGEMENGAATGIDLESLARLGAELSSAARNAEGPPREAAWLWLDAVRRSEVLRAIVAAGETDRWMDIILEVLDASRFGVGPLIDQRVARYGPRPLFRTSVLGRERQQSWLDAGARIEHLGRGLLALRDELGAGPVAILSENRPDTALLDLACLAGGIVDVIVPANSTDEDAAYILKLTGARALVVSGDAQAAKIEPHRSALPELRAVFSVDRPRGGSTDLRPLSDLVLKGSSVPRERWEAAKRAAPWDSLATVMFTSGTTGRPKGICFSQRNIVSKRFARGLALPEIGDHDVFLCYLPLFHTFGRYLELMGTVFWGAQYVFLEDPSQETLREGMRRARPTVFISVPKKWIELWEEIGRRVDLEGATEGEARAAMREVVGDRLRWGLSAAGFLDPEIFRFFQDHGVELLSGFGMTEATGGITMTPPGRYREDTLGIPLPGIDAELADGGELRIRGPYVMIGYLDTGEGTGLDKEGWLHTGDIMEQDDEGYFRLVDRKKDLYKNIKGESIAPQRVENLFRDFDAVKRAFLVGDHRPYNTLLIVPNLEYDELDFRDMSAREMRETFRSIVVSVNRFLAPFERVVDFALLDRDFDLERGELTPKGTYRRRAIVDSFHDVIEPLYRRVHFRLPDPGLEVHVPNWIFQHLGLTANDVQLAGDRILLGASGAGITVAPLGRRDGAAEIRLGSSRYIVRSRTLDLGLFLTCPALWLGNEELVRSADLPPAVRVRRLRAPREVALLGRAVPFELAEGDEQALRRATGHPAPTLEDVDVAARMLASLDDDDALLALGVIGKALRGEEGPVHDAALLALRLAAEVPSLTVRRRAFQILFPVETEGQLSTTLDRYLAGGGEVLDGHTIARVSEESLSPARIAALVGAAEAAGGIPEMPEDGSGPALLRLLGEYGAAHPARFETLRTAIVRIEAFAASETMRAEAVRALQRLIDGFREWLGSVQRIAVDPEEGTEYRWEDVLTFEEGIDAADEARLGKAIAETGVLREAIFLFTGEALVRLADIPPGGVYITFVGERGPCALYRVVTHTRLQGSYDVVFCLNRGMSAGEIASELRWLIATGSDGPEPPLCQKIGGWWEEPGIWTEEFLGGETMERVMVRIARQHEHEPVDRLQILGPFFLWSAAWGYLEFWKRTRRRFVLARPSPANVVVPTHDYQGGTRLVSASEMEPAPDVGTMLDGIWVALAGPLALVRPDLAGSASPGLLCAALVDVLGVEDGLAQLRGAAEREGPVGRTIDSFVSRVEAEGFLPQRLLWAVERFLRWEALAPDAPAPARAETLQEIYETYRLNELLRVFPESRLRFFRRTVLRDVGPEVADGLDAIAAEVRQRKLEGDDLTDRLLALRRHMRPGSPEEYFLARLTYPHLRPGDEADFLSTDLGGTRQTDIVVSLEDDIGRPYRVRHPVSAKEVARLHRLFITARLDVSFRPENQYLVAINERGRLIGGIFYDVDPENRSAHLDKIVVGGGYRKHGVSDGLMNEFFNRLRNAGIETVTTGFFRPSYFYRFGFTVGKRQAGLVKSLTG